VPAGKDVPAGSAAPLVLGVGEVLWDRLPGGDELGGAPLNVISHLARLGYRAAYLTAVGQDPPGDAALAAMASRGVDPALARRVPAAPTGLARVTVGPDGSPEFAISRPAAFEYWADEYWADEPGAGVPEGHEPGAGVPGAGAPGVAAALARRPAVLVYGTLAQLRPSARAALARIAPAVPVALYDVNLRDGWWTAAVVARLAGLASVLKLSLAEAGELAGALGVGWPARPGDSLAGWCAELARRHGLRGVAVTAGPGPAALWLDGGYAAARPPAIEVADAVGAGDAFAAGLLDAIGRGLPAAAALRRASALGALVASRHGAQPAWTAAELAVIERR
jgi:fructokinase